MRRWVVEDGSLVSPERRDWSEDRAFSHGYGVFETMLMVDSRLISANLHFSRMNDGCERLGIAPPDLASVQEAIAEGIRVLGLDEGRVRIRLTRTGGRGPLNERGGEDEATLLEMGPLPPVPESVKVILSPWVRNEGSPLAGIKCLSYAENLVALDDARLKGADEAILGNSRGEICEAAMANVFLVENNKLFTPHFDSGCLLGTARERVIRLARHAGIEVVEDALQLFRLDLAEEMFLTSATRGVVPVAEIDDRALPAPGPIGARMRDAFEASLLKAR